MNRQSIKEDEDIVGQVAIIGMDGRFPGAPTLDLYWSNLLSGHSSITPLAERDLIEAGVSDILLNDPTYVRVAAHLENVDLFAANLFGITARDALLMDPQHRLFLETSYALLQSIGHKPDDHHMRVGIFGGASFSDYFFEHFAEQIKSFKDQGILLAILHGNSSDYLCSRVAYKLNLKGPAMSIQTACSTSLVAVHVACQNLLTYQCDLALAGGVTVRVPQKSGYLYQSGSIFSKSGVCRPFDSRADGTVFGSGVGLVALKRLEDAIADQDEILAVIKGSAVNNDGAIRPGFTAPSPEGQADVIAQALGAANVLPEELCFIEAHGTATQLGDPIEFTALSQAFNASHQSHYCALGSVKANIGHLNAAAGIAGLIKATLAIKHRVIPPQIHFEIPNPKINLEEGPFYITKEPITLKNTQSMIGGVSSFGMGGTNAHVILSNSPIQKISQAKKYMRQPLSRQPYWFKSDIRVMQTRHARPEMRVPYSPPETSIEKVLAEILYELFNFRQIGVNDDFYELGGDSLLATQLLNRVHEKLPIKMRIEQFNNLLTIKTLALHIEELLSEKLMEMTEEEAALVLEQLESQGGGSDNRG